MTGTHPCRLRGSGRTYGSVNEMAHSLRPQVVIVDDQRSFRDAARELLEARGYDVVAEAGSAATARDAVDHHDPFAVLLDVRLGDDDGFAVCGELTRSHPEPRRAARLRR